ncbi:hypothetical protein [Acinetobacter indicus]|uniref:hypothetical protein n=1 Tax=Acinetobacter indicus TaxID=756892 RepID=UPI00131598E8|nr:hypothetical protein [Acinetobacter indicus]MDM1244058.1 hypothetical protein [Acinetobacter indicus]MDM1288111.1 hypothetical protein [Acinetobacter indicus]
MPLSTILLWSVLPPFIMLLWIWALRFPQSWVLKVCIGFEVLVTLLVLLIEMDARQTPGNGGWMMILFTVFQIYVGLAIGVIRLVMWCLKRET